MWQRYHRPNQCPCSEFHRHIKGTTGTGSCEEKSKIQAGRHTTSSGCAEGRAKPENREMRNMNVSNGELGYKGNNSTPGEGYTVYDHPVCFKWLDEWTRGQKENGNTTSLGYDMVIAGDKPRNDTDARPSIKTNRLVRVTKFLFKK